MGKVGYRFLVIFFTWFGALIVFINFVGWSGAYVNVVSHNNVNWSNSYFGFESVSLMIRTLNISIDKISFLSVKNFSTHLNSLLDSLAFGIPSMLANIDEGGADILDILKIIGYVIGGQPLVLLANSCIVLAHILWYALNFVSILLLAFGGRFNVRFDSPITPSSVSTMYRITVPLLV